VAPGGGKKKKGEIIFLFDQRNASEILFLVGGGKEGSLGCGKKNEIGRGGVRLSRVVEGGGLSSHKGDNY